MDFLLEDIRYKEILSIDRLALMDSEITCIVGESGSGKTTLLRLLNNLITPDSGSVKYQGIDITQIDPIALRRRIVMLPQNPTIFPGTIEQNLQIGLEFAERPQAEPEQLLNALLQAKLTKALATNAAELSGGEKQRLALARILLLHPEVLLLDEPSSALDEETEKLVIENVVSYSRAHQIALIMVTHSKGVAHSYGNTVVTIHNGQVTSVKEMER